MNCVADVVISPETPDQAAPAAGHEQLISIIIPCHNGEAFLKETIESALAQTYRHVEIIVVDDGSTDGSADIARAFPVRYIHQQNRGLTASRNLGIQESRGSYIVFLDADDRLKPDALEIGLRVLNHHPGCAMTVGDHLFISADGAYLGPSHKRIVDSAHYEALLHSNFIEMISSVLFRKSVFAAVGFFDTSLRVAEDYELYLRIAREHSVCCHRAIVAEYRLHRANVSRNAELMLTQTLDVLKTQKRFIKGNPGLQSAYTAGRARWRKQYGRQLATELARSFAQLPVSTLGRKLLVLLRHYPQGLGMVLLLILVPSLKRREARGNAQRRDEAAPLLAGLQPWVDSSKHSRSPIS